MIKKCFMTITLNFLIQTLHKYKYKTFLGNQFKKGEREITELV